MSGAGVSRAGLERLRAGARGISWFFSSLLGGQDYRRYVEHLRRRHPEHPIPSERDYWRERWAEADRNPQQRCC